MGLINEVYEAIGTGLDSFKQLVQTYKKSHIDISEQFIGLQNGKQVTVLNVLIQAHQESNNEKDRSSRNLTECIDYLLTESSDKNTGEPLHQAIHLKKIQLAMHLLEAPNPLDLNQEQMKVKVKQFLSEHNKKNQVVIDRNKKNQFDVDKRDIYGRTLLFLALNTKNVNLLIALLEKQPNVHAPTLMPNVNIPFQPIHQSVMLDFADGVRLLGNQGAQFANPIGPMMDTPLTLAARLGKINALEALLEHPIDNLLLEGKNNNYYLEQNVGHTAIEELCERIATNDNKTKAIKGVAMLLCRGAEPPRNEDMRNILCEYRIPLLKAIHKYLEDKPELVDPFVNRCHLVEGTLHNIIYADHSWGSSIRHLFGVPSEAAFMVEKLVVRKYSDNEKFSKDTKPLSTKAAETLNGEKNPLKLYADFVRRYEETYNSQTLTNRWSTMRWMIAEGKCNWETVERYAKNHPASRTAIVYRDMFSPLPNLHEEMDESKLEIENRGC